MRKAYLLVYNDELGSRDVVKATVDAMPFVINWRYELPNTFYLISELSAHELGNKLREKLGNKGRFILTEVTANKQGWLPPKSWKFFNEKPGPDAA